MLEYTLNSNSCQNPPGEAQLVKTPLVHSWAILDGGHRMVFVLNSNVKSN